MAKKNIKENINKELESVLKKEIASDITDFKVQFFNRIKKTCSEKLLKDGFFPNTVFAVRLNKEMIIIEHQAEDGESLKKSGENIAREADDIICFCMAGIRKITLDKVNIRHALMIHAINCLGDSNNYIYIINEDKNAKVISLDDKSKEVKIENDKGWKNAFLDGDSISRYAPLETLISHYVVYNDNK